MGPEMLRMKIFFFHVQGHGHGGDALIHFAFGDAVAILQDLQQLILQQPLFRPVLRVQFFHKGISQFFRLGSQEGLAGGPICRGTM